MSIPFDEKELQVVGEYHLPGIYGGNPKTTPKYNRPITPKENMHRYLKNDNPVWMPDNRRDCATICPYVMPDSYARAFGGTDWFGIEWQYEPRVKAGMVKPGTRRLSDITKWEEELVFPDLNAIDWEADVKNNYAEGLSEERFTTFVIQNGMFERTADLTSFEDTFLYLLEEPEALTAFYDRLAEWHIDLMKIAKKYYNADCILFHDDMGSQKAPFFSSAIYQELFVPQYQKITKAAHDMGMYIVLHSCGNVGVHMQDFIDAGFDGWEGQDACNDKKALSAVYGDRLFQQNMVMIGPEYSDEEAIALVKGLVDENIGQMRVLPGLFVAGNRSVSVEDEYYKYSRLKFAENAK